MRVFLFVLPFLIAILISLNKEDKMPERDETKIQEKKEFEKATFGGGCFWCTQAVFKVIDGVVETEVGYAGGELPNPTYEQVCTGKTGHAEVCQVTFDPQKVSYTELLEIFFKTHDPTTLNRQGADVGTQYRSVIFYHNESQRAAAANFIQKLEREKVFADPIVTQIEPLKNYYKAEEYHQNYFEKNPYSTYCILVIAPKVEKTLKLLKGKQGL